MEIDFVDSFVGLFSSSKRIYWQYIISALFIALIYFLTLEKKVGILENYEAAYLFYLGA